MFKRPSGTSRGVLTSKETYFLLIEKENAIGIGECALFRGLSYDDTADYEEVLQEICADIYLGLDELYSRANKYPSIQFGLEQAFLSLDREDPFALFPSSFTSGQASIEINGLIWMGELSFMKEQIKRKVDEGFRCIKLKIGALNFKEEYRLLQEIREEFPVSQIELRLDANGAFAPEDALKKLEDLAGFEIHSIEQPIKPGNHLKMKELCMHTPIPIALDEELIGVLSSSKRQNLLDTINPQYIILKPSLVGGYKASNEWIKLAEERSIGWWVTSALESNIGLNAIAQWTYMLETSNPQGLGTGQLFTNNISSPLEMAEGQLIYGQKNKWNLKSIKELCL